MAIGFATAVAGGALFANAEGSSTRWKAGIGGLLVGLGLGGTLVGCYVLVVLPSEPGKTPASLSVGGKF